MGGLFKKARKSIVAQTILVRTAIRGLLAAYLYKNEEDADELAAALDEAIKVIKDPQYDTEDALHKALQDAIEKYLATKPLYVKVTLLDTLNAILSIAAEKFGSIDEDNILSPEEREAWLDVLQGAKEICEMAKAEAARRQRTA